MVDTEIGVAVSHWLALTGDLVKQPDDESSSPEADWQCTDAVAERKMQRLAADGD